MTYPTEPESITNALNKAKDEVTIAKNFLVLSKSISRAPSCSRIRAITRHQPFLEKITDIAITGSIKPHKHDVLLKSAANKLFDTIVDHTDPDTAKIIMGITKKYIKDAISRISPHHHIQKVASAHPASISDDVTTEIVHYSIYTLRKGKSDEGLATLATLIQNDKNQARVAKAATLTLLVKHDGAITIDNFKKFIDACSVAHKELPIDTPNRAENTLTEITQTLRKPPI